MDLVTVQNSVEKLPVAFATRILFGDTHSVFEVAAGRVKRPLTAPDSDALGRFPVLGRVCS